MVLHTAQRFDASNSARNFHFAKHAFFLTLCSSDQSNPNQKNLSGMTIVSPGSTVKSPFLISRS
jgi:hypothetical protein